MIKEKHKKYHCSKCNTDFTFPDNDLFADLDDDFYCGLCSEPQSLGAFLLQAVYSMKAESGQI